MYDILLFVGYAFLCIVAPFNEKVRLWLKAQNDNMAGIGKSLRHNESPIVWMHCSSLGEFEQGRPLLEKFKKQHPEFKALITFFSLSGYESCKNYSEAEYICRLPYDTSFNAKKFVNIVNPSLVLWIRYDFWPGHLKELKKRNIPVYLISSSFRKNQIFFKPWGQFFRSALSRFRYIFVQNAESKNLLESIGITNVSAAGDTRFDRVVEIANKQAVYPIIKRFIEVRPVLIAGSSWPKDEVVLADVIDNFPGLKLIIAPHEIDDRHVSDIVRLFERRKAVKYTEADSADVSDCDTLILNTMGMLSSVYGYADVAFIGCGFDDGIHNISEAAVYGIPVVFGPNYQKFEEANDLVALKGAVSINNAEELTAILELWYSDPAIRTEVGDICRQYIKTRSGTTEKILKIIGDLQSP